MTEETSVKNLRSRFEASSLKQRPPLATKPSGTVPHAPGDETKPTETRSSRTGRVNPSISVESPKPLPTTETGDSFLTDPFSSPASSPALEIQRSKPPLPLTKPRSVANHGKQMSHLLVEPLVDRDERTLHTDLPSSPRHQGGEPISRPGSAKPPPPPPSPRVRSPRPSARLSSDMMRPLNMTARDIFADAEPSTVSMHIADHISDSLTGLHTAVCDSDEEGHSRSSVSRPLSGNDFATPALPPNRPSLEHGPPSTRKSIMSPPAYLNRSASTSSSLSESPVVSSASGASQIDENFKPALPSRPTSIQVPSQKITTIDEVNQLEPARPDPGRKPTLPRRLDYINTTQTGISAPGTEIAPQLPARSNTVDSTRSHQGRKTSFQHDRNAQDVPFPARRSLDVSRSTSGRTLPHDQSRDNDDSEGEDDMQGIGGDLKALDQPDASTANRKPPRFKGTHWDLLTGKEVRKTALSGDLLMVAHNDKLKLHNLLTGDITWQVPVGDTKVTAMEFRTVNVGDLSESGRFLWVAFKDGSIHELDIHNRMIVERYFHAHSGSIVSIMRSGRCMWTLDEGGTLQIWSDTKAVSLKGRPSHRSIRTVVGVNVAVVVDGLLWIGSGRSVHVFDPTTTGPTKLTPDRGLEPNRVTGLITCVVHLAHTRDLVYFGHDDGKISVYSASSLKCVEVLSISHYNLSELLGVGDYLWASFKTGKIFVYDVLSRPWKVLKEWHAHKSPILELALDRTSLWKGKRLQVSSMAGDGAIKIWDGLLMEDWLDAEMQRRVKDFCNFSSISTLICTWNAGASVPQKLGRDYEDSQFMENMIREADSPDIIVFGFQELVDLDDKGKAGRSVAKGLFGKKKEKEPDEKAQAAAYQQWQNHLERQVAISTPAKDGYSRLQVRNLVGLFTCVFVRQSLRQRIVNVEAINVKTGLKGRYGNKGAIVVRFVLDDSSICLVNCHLAAGQKHVIARNNDAFAIMDHAGLSAAPEALIRNNVFVSGGDGSMVLDHEICILNGDLNYRINGARSQVLQNVKEGRLTKLLENDQLLLELRKNATHRLRFFSESTITFPPTYKFDPGTDNYDSSEKMRVPAWCDRVFYRGMGSSEINCARYQAHICRVSDHRPVSALLHMQVKTVLPEKRKSVFEEVAQQWIVLANKTIVARKIMVLREVTGRSEKECRDALRASDGQVVSDAAIALIGSG